MSFLVFHSMTFMADFNYMTSQESAFKKSEIALMAALSLLAMAIITVAVVPSLRTKVKDLVSSEQREVIAKATGSLSSEGPRVTVLKIRSKNTLSIEVYSLDNPQEMTLMTRIPLFETRDGFFMLQGNATNLAITDIDKDGTLEIVAPTYDEQMVPRLNIYRFNPDSKNFDRVNAPPGFEP